MKKIFISIFLLFVLIFILLTYSHNIMYKNKAYSFVINELKTNSIFQKTLREKGIEYFDCWLNSGLSSDRKSGYYSFVKIEKELSINEIIENSNILNKMFFSTNLKVKNPYFFTVYWEFSNLNNKIIIKRIIYQKSEIYKQ